MAYEQFKQFYFQVLQEKLYIKNDVSTKLKMLYLHKEKRINATIFFVC